MKTKIIYLRYRERVIITLFLCALLFTGICLLSLLETVVESYPYLSLLFLCVFIFTAVFIQKIIKRNKA